MRRISKRDVGKTLTMQTKEKKALISAIPAKKEEKI